MAGHSQFKNIMHRKGAQDAKKAKAFTKVIREIIVAVKESGADPESNPRLRAAILAARTVQLVSAKICRKTILSVLLRKHREMMMMFNTWKCVMKDMDQVVLPSLSKL